MQQTPFQYTVLFDGHCPICLASVRRLKRWDTRGALVFLAAQDPSVPRDFSQLSREALVESLHLVGPGGEVWQGAEALEVLVNLLPGLSRARFLFRVPLVRPVARRVYRWIARNRYRFSCEKHCGKPGNKKPV
jgi:predicted DCC family thiol-disulfide oxidoreductase YuxK